MNKQSLLALLEKHRAGTLSPAEEKLLHAWLDAVEQDAAAEEPLAPREKKALQQQMWAQIRTAMPRRLRGLYGVGAAAAIIAAMAAAAYFLFQPAAKPAATLAFSTGFREIKTVTLPDQSRLTLGPNTQLTYHQRHIHITRGRAYFDVAQNADTAFVLTSGKMNVTVLGTTFTLEVSPVHDIHRITLLTGKVKAGGYGIMQPHQRLTLQQNRTVLDTAQTADALAWTRGEIVLRNASLAEVMHTLEENYQIPVKTDLNTQAGNYTFRFPARMPLQEVLDIIEKISYKPKIRFSMNKHQLTIN